MGSVGAARNNVSAREEEEDTINVLITGFAPFRANYPINPSWEIAKSLPEYLPPNPPTPFPGIAGHVPPITTTGIPPDSTPSIPLPKVKLLVHPTPIHVGYRAVRDLIPSLWHLDSPDHPRIDLAIHIGMAGPRGHYSIERRAHKTGYTMGDVDNNLLSDLDASLPAGTAHPWEDLPEELLSGLDMEDVLERWRKFCPPYSDLRISEDAGHYLCDFIYYSSLAHLVKSEERGKGKGVVFLHVPSEASPAWVKVGRELCLGLVRGMVESEVLRGRGKERKGVV
ncbi:putative peptidase [Triangularia verruculosa]|uniref:Peptidase n=1 Tax=Triangularia verruculosa TaxID=2587418 RepID=A0AAN6XTJ2_9PEZI|nr:putative peptidase [Triangularia verruculosa]